MKDTPLISLTTASDRPEAAVFPTTPKHLGFLAGSLLLMACSLAPRAGAISVYTLAPGANQTALASTFPTGGTLLGSVTAPFASGTLQGTFISDVYSGDASNPYGGLTFTYLIELNSSSTDSSSEFTVGGFAGSLTDVSFNQSGAEVAPSNFMRSGNGSVIHSQFNSSIELPSGDTGALVVVQSNAHNFGAAFGSVIDSTAVTVPILAPVPEPGVLSLVAVGFGALFIFRRRSSR